MPSNDLSGQLPKTFLSGCYSLRILKLSNNRLQGKVFSEHANLIGSVWLALDGNNFNGSLGKGLLNSKDLYILDVSNNSISGMFPLWISRFSSLSYLYMRGNQLKGPFPRQLQLINVRVLSLQSNEFMGLVPDTLFEVERLEVLDLRNNNFSGMILNGKGSNLTVLLLWNNSLQTHISEKICQVLSKVGLLDLSHKKFEGVIPSCLGNMSFGAERVENFVSFDIGLSFGGIQFLRNWRYTSDLILIDYLDYLEHGYTSTPETRVEFLTKSRYETYQGQTATVMYGLDLSNNQLSGEISVEIGNLHNTISLNLSSNRLTGSIPNSISKLKDLESLDLSNNKLDGNVPPQLAGLDSLGFFNVSYNNLSGEISINGHLLTFKETSYIGNAHLCGLPTNTSCNPQRVPELSASKQGKEGDGVMV